MQIQLTPEIASIVKELLETGDYHDQDEVIAEAVLLLGMSGNCATSGRYSSRLRGKSRGASSRNGRQSCAPGFPPRRDR
jgi:hypothetical protein